MKYIRKINILLGLLIIVGVTSCEKEYEDVARITYFPDIVITGSEDVFIAAGGSYADEGAKAFENEVEIEVKSSSNVNTDKVGAYTVGYSAENSDGFSKTVSRNVYVYDPSTSSVDHSGTYTANVVRNGGESYTENKVTLTAVPGVGGVYLISDWIAGFYAVGRGYGSGYAFPGVIQIKGNNEVIEVSMTNAWGDPFDSVVGTYDPATGKINYSAKWIGRYDFVVDMTK